MKQVNKVAFVVVVLAIGNIVWAERSFLRMQDPLPELHISYVDTPAAVHIIRNPYLQAMPIFKSFDKEFFKQHMLPRGPIRYRLQPERTVTGDTLNTLLESLMRDIAEHKKEYRHFTVLKNKEFYPEQGRGFLVVRFKDYPFVAKIFMEQPAYAFVMEERNFQAYSMYVMNGGLGRFEVGFSRIKNNRCVHEQLCKNPVWPVLVEGVAKWYWMPTNVRWMAIKGYNFGPQGPLNITLPSVYAVIADAVDVESRMALSSKGESQFCLELCRYLQFCIDPHIANFVIEKRTVSAQERARRLAVLEAHGKHVLPPAAYKTARKMIAHDRYVVLIDTEHFHDLVGIHDYSFDAHNYLAWYINLGKKFLEDKFFTLKSRRRTLRGGR